MNWELVEVISVGGLVNLSFIPKTNLLIAVSHNGRGIFNCLTGERIARSYEEIWNVFDDETRIVKGFDMLEGQTIQTQGLYGGDNLPKTTNDGWFLEKTEENSISEIYLNSPDGTVKMVGNDAVTEIKAFGFSADGEFFTVANSNDFVIYKREE